MRLASEVHKMSNHAPGPWFSPDGKTVKQDYRPIGLSDAAGCMIASVMGGPTSGPAFIEVAEEVAANTRLIAAAPICLALPSDSWHLMRNGIQTVTSPRSRNSWPKPAQPSPG